MDSQPSPTPLGKAPATAIGSLAAGLLLGMAAIFTNYLAFGFLRALQKAQESGALTDGTGFAAILFIHVCLVLASVVAILLGIAALTVPNRDKRLARCAIAVNLVPSSTEVRGKVQRVDASTAR